MRLAWGLATALLIVVACGRKSENGVDAGGTTSPSATATASGVTTAMAPPPATSTATAAPSPCPEDMAYVDTMFCPDMERECVDVEHEEPNHLKICHKYSPEQRCRVKEEHRQFCIDKYEYPNKKGAHPVWMRTWTEAQATCKSKGKRLCWASEWTAACEGPDHTPFPYGFARDHDKCNIDNFFIDPIKKGNFLFYSKDPEVQSKELARLDQSVASGEMEGCVNGFGVYDMTGNMDEWVTSDQPPKEKSKWAGLKGGAWGHVRNACRPMTFSHEPEFYYYFVSFRCCADAAGAPVWHPDGRNVPAPEVEAHDFAPEPIVVENPHGPSKTKCGRSDWNRKGKKKS
jgi:hypothetical protein